MKIDARQLEQEISNLFADCPELADDEQLRADMLEGSTNIDAVLTALLNVERDACAMMDAIKTRKSDLDSRKARFERQQESARKSIQRILEIANLTKRVLPEGTLTIAKKPHKVLVQDELLIPADYMRYVASPKLVEIKKAIEEGKAVPGCTLDNGGTTLTVKVG